VLTDSIDSSPDLLVGVDVGGTKVAVLVVDGQRHIRSRIVAPPELSSPQRTLDGIAAAIRQALALGGASLREVAAIGVGIPGRVDPQTGVVRLAVNLNWREMAVGSWLSQELGIPCYLEKDVRAAALGVRLCNGSSAAQNMIYVGIGTGIGAGVILRGQLFHGAHGMAGEIGHMIVEPNGPRCQCGAQGCLEALAAGPAIARLAQQAVESGQTTRLRDYSPLTAESVYQAAETGDAAAQAIAAAVGGYLGRALQVLVMTYDVEEIVLGGGVSRAGKTFLAPIVRELERQRRQSALAREMLRLEMFKLLPTDCDAGTWGAVAIAAQAWRDLTRAKGGVNEISHTLPSLEESFDKREFNPPQS
jgi:glucokinase